MNKKFIFTALTALCVSVCAAGLSACRTSHKHDYAQRVVAPTYLEEGFTLFMCECGNAYKRDVTEATGHSYVESTVNPTCTEKGYNLHTCSFCGENYADGEVTQRVTVWWSAL